MFSVATNLMTAVIMALALTCYVPRPSTSMGNALALLVAIVTIPSILVGINIVYAFYIYPHVNSPLRRFPTAKQVAVHKRWLKQPTEYSDALNLLKTAPSNNGLIRVHGLLNEEFLMVTNIDTMKLVLGTNSYSWIKIPFVADMLRVMIGDGLVTTEGQAHKHQRKVLQPSFNFRHIQDLYPVYWDKTRELLKCLAEDISRPDSEAVVNIQDWMGRTTLDIVASAAFGLEFASLANPGGPMVKDYRVMFENEPLLIVDLLRRCVPAKVLTSLPTQGMRNITQSKSAIESHMRKIIQQRRKSLAEFDNKVSDKDVLSVAMQAESFTDRELLDHSMTFLAAGQDTTSFALSCAILELSQHQEIQDRLRTEIRSHLASPESEEGSSITSTAIDNLPLLTAVCNESLRLYPSAVLTSRINLKDTMIAGERIPKGTFIVLPLLAFNQFEPFWSGTAYDPSKWQPERWFEDWDAGKLNSAGGAVDAWAFMTFLRGPRSCIGERFARSEMMTVLAGLIGRFRFEFQGASGKGNPIEDLDIKYGFTGHIRGGVWVSVHDVDGW